LVHFDGHGTYVNLADLRPDDEDGNGTGDPAAAGDANSGDGNGEVALSVAGPVRAGQHGYLLFEDPDSPTNQKFVDGLALGQLLAATGVSVLVLNAGRSAYAEAPPEPLDVEVGHDDAPAYDSFAAEAAKAGLVGVVAMRYDVYVLTMVQFVADLYAALLAGQSLGAAVTAGRRQLAAQPNRAMASGPWPLQDWMVPVVYEAAPLILFRPATTTGQPKLLVNVGSAMPNPGAGSPRPPDIGFFGQDGTLLALDRAFDISQVVLLHAFAGAGKTATAAEFARWYQATGGLLHPVAGGGPVLWSSFEHYPPLDRLLDAAGNVFVAALEASGIHWHAITDAAERRGLVLQILQQVPVLWVWDNTDPVTGFPPGTRSAWTQDEQDQIAGFLRDLAQQTKCKVLLTSRRVDSDWLGDLPTGVALSALPMREAIQFTQALAERHGHNVSDVADWRPLLRYAAGNPLTITVLVGQALRDGLTSREQIEGFVARLRAGESDLDDDEAQSRSRSLSTALDYGMAAAFTDAERTQLAALCLFQETVDVDALVFMGARENPHQLIEMATLDRESGNALLDRATEIGVLTALGGGTYTIHSTLPWYLRPLYQRTIGRDETGPDDTGRAKAAYATAIARLGLQYSQWHRQSPTQAVDLLRVAEANLLHVCVLATRAAHWVEALACMQGLHIFYRALGRTAEWARLVDELVPYLVDPVTGGPLPGREQQWAMLTDYRVRIARDVRDWPAARQLQDAAIAFDRQQATDALHVPAEELDDLQRHQIRNLAVDLLDLGQILREQDDPGCVQPFMEAMELYRRIGDRHGEDIIAFNLGDAFRNIPALRDLDQAEHWYRRHLELVEEHDTLGRARGTMQLGNIASERFDDARAAGAPQEQLLRYLNDAAAAYYRVLDLTPKDAADDLAVAHGALGNAYNRAGQTDQALTHYVKSIQYDERQDNRYRAGRTRLNAALTLRLAGRHHDAILYARAALRDAETVGTGAAALADKARQLIAELEQEPADEHHSTAGDDA
jgi:tetratricopeptide (TPR) repeat protein